MRAVLALALTLSGWVQAEQQPPVFSAGTRTVLVDVSVKRASSPVVGLAATDFVLSDNGVPQRIDALSIEAVPIDVSLFIDTSGSAALTVSQMRRTVGEIGGMLRRGDRFRLLTIGNSVYQPVAWTEAGTPIDAIEIVSVRGNSLVYDAVYAAAAHAVAPGRRHLVIAVTDGDDCGSVIRPARLRNLIGRTEAVVHWVPLTSLGSSRGFRGTRAVCEDPRPNVAKLDDADLAALEDVVAGTGGAVHRGLVAALVGGAPVRAFKAVLDDYRESYVLRYTPEGVALSGWHQIKVEVPSGKYTVRARAGYFGN